jgi:hypothetical protein
MTSVTNAQPAPLAIPVRSQKSTLIGMLSPAALAPEQAQTASARPPEVTRDSAVPPVPEVPPVPPSAPPPAEVPAAAPPPNSATISSEPVSKSAPNTSTPPSFRPPREGRGSRWLLVAAAAIGVLVLGGRYLMRAERVEAEAPRAAAPPAVTATVAPAPTITADPAAAAPATPTSAPPADSAANPEAVAEPAASSAAAPTPTATAAATAAPAESAAGGDVAPAASADLVNTKRTVVVTISPPNARLFRHGKPVGASPVTIELEPGEKRRLYEVGGRGWVTRKLSVDGSKPEIFIGLKPDPSTALPAGQRP